MITDALLVLSDAQSNIRAAATYVSTNTIDLRVAEDLGAGEDLLVLFTVDVAFAGGTSVEINLISSASSDLSSPTVLSRTPPILEASLGVGANFIMRMPRTYGGKGQRYFGAQYIGVGTHTAGSISARIVKDVGDPKYYPSGFSTAS